MADIHIFKAALLSCAALIFSATLYGDAVSDKYGYPTTNGVQVLERPAYSVGYSRLHSQPMWVQYRIEGTNFCGKAHGRSNDFREDAEVDGGSATLEDYRASGYDRGHLAPAADFSYSAERMSESFLMSNMSPQTPDFNRGIWKDLESWVRSVARREGRVVVVTGGVFPCGNSRWSCIGRRKMVTVPTRFYKVVLDETEPRKAIGFVLDNAGSKSNLVAFVRSVDDIERETGLDFFCALPNDEQDALEREADASAWGLQDGTEKPR